MLSRCLRHALCLLIGWLAWPALAAEVQHPSDWPQFQGPAGNGSSPETDLLRRWPAAGPRVAWRVAIKPGWGSPTVVGDDVYLGWTEQLRGDQETIACLSASNGDLRWKHTYEVGPYWERNIGWARGGFRSSPCVSGDRLFTLGAVGHLFCFDRRDGTVLWSCNLWDEWNPSGEKGYVFSPVVADGKLLLWYSDGVTPAKEPRHDFDKNPQGFGVLCRALDVETGQELWRFFEPHHPRTRCGEGQTPALAEFGGDRCLVGTANGELKAIRVADGKQVWTFPCPKPQTRGTTTPTPLVVDRYIVNIPDIDSAQAVLVDRTQLDQPARSAWEQPLDIFTPIHQFRHHQGYLYGFAGQVQGADEKAASDSQLNLVCIELATGKLQWSEPGFQAGVSLTLADGLLFVRSYQKLRLIEANPQEYQLRGETKTHEVWKPTLNLLDFVQPVLSRGRLFVRTPEELIAYDIVGSR